MPVSLVVLIPAIGFVLAMWFGRWWIVLLPPISWELFFLGFEAGWWGYGFGDGWLFAFISQMLVGVAAVGVALLLRRLRLLGAQSEAGTRSDPRAPTGQSQVMLRLDMRIALLLLLLTVALGGGFVAIWLSSPAVDPPTVPVPSDGSPLVVTSAEPGS